MVRNVFSMNKTFKLRSRKKNGSGKKKAKRLVSNRLWKRDRTFKKFGGVKKYKVVLQSHTDDWPDVEDREYYSDEIPTRDELYTFFNVGKKLATSSNEKPLDSLTHESMYEEITDKTLKEAFKKNTITLKYLLDVEFF